MTLTERLAPLGPGIGELRILPPDPTGWVWCEIELPLERYTVSMVTESAMDADIAVRLTVAKARTFQRDRKARVA